MIPQFYRIVQVLPTLESSGVRVIAVGLGTAANAQEFSRILKFPLDHLYADPEGTIYKALAFSPGFAPGLEVSAPYHHIEDHYGLA